MARTRQTRAATVPGAGTLFALRAIGLVIGARWLFSMSQMNFVAALEGMTSSPWACINLVFLFLLIFLPGARARVERPFHPLPQWLRQALRLLAALGFLFALWSVGAFVWTVGWRRTVHAVVMTNGWLVVAPALYAAVAWLCRPRALWRTNVAARRFAIGRYAVSLEAGTRTTIVWLESRKVGQYDARELSVRWPPEAGAGSAGARVPAPVETAGQTGDAENAAPPADVRLLPPVGEAAALTGEAQPLTGVRAATAVDAPEPSSGTREVGSVSAVSSTPGGAGASGARSPIAAPRGFWHRRVRIELLWDSPAAAGHNRQTVFRVSLVTDGDRVAARALDVALRQA